MAGPDECCDLDHPRRTELLWTLNGRTGYVDARMGYAVAMGHVAILLTNAFTVYFFRKLQSSAWVLGWEVIRYTIAVAYLVEGAHFVARESVMGSSIFLVIKICANPDTNRARAYDMDVKAGDIIKTKRFFVEVGREIRDLVVAVTAGQQAKSEEFWHQEFILTYKSLKPIGTA